MCGVPRIATRSSATTRAMSFVNGDAQRLNSSSKTSFGPVLTTICGWSTIDGIDTGPTTTERLELFAADASAGFAVAFKV